MPAASLAQVAVEQRADVTAQGGLSSTPGTVTSVGLLPATGGSTSATPSYPVVVLVPDAGPALATGSRAEVSIVVGTSRNVLTVPLSAIGRTAAGSAFVTTLSAGVTSRSPVLLGRVGNTDVEVRSGVRLGEKLVLATLAAPLPTSSGLTVRQLGSFRPGAGLRSGAGGTSGQAPGG